MSDDAAEFTRDELIRYARHLNLPEFSLQAQSLLKRARVLLIGAGGLGSPCALYLAAAGLGHLRLADHDVVEMTNLQRQVLHRTTDVGRKKVESASEHLTDLNPHVRVEAIAESFNAANADRLLDGVDLVIDGSDNFATRYVVNAAAVAAGIPCIHASVFRFEGRLAVFGLPHKACYRCIFPDPPPPSLVPDCAAGGILGVVPGILGTLQACEAIKLLTGIGNEAGNDLLIFNALTLDMRRIKLAPDPQCPVCGSGKVSSADDYPMPDQTPCAAGINAGNGIHTVTVDELQAMMRNEEVFHLVDVREAHEYGICNLQGKLMPFSEFPRRLAELDPWRQERIVLHCKSGSRSRAAANMLAAQGFTDVLDLEGGILEWRRRFSPEWPAY